MGLLRVEKELIVSQCLKDIEEGLDMFFVSRRYGTRASGLKYRKIDSVSAQGVSKEIINRRVVRSCEE